MGWQTARQASRMMSWSMRSDVSLISPIAEVWPGKPLQIGINGIALSPNADTLYWTVTTGTHAHALPTAILREASATHPQIADRIEDLGSVGGNTDGLVTDSAGNLYITDVTHNGIVKYDPQTRSMTLVASSTQVHWPDTPAIRPDGDLVFTSSGLNDHFAGVINAGQERYDLWRMPLHRQSENK